MSHSFNRQQLLLARARGMRFHPTASEALLWSAIRGKRLGVQFRRQQVIGDAIVDFLAASLVVEVDGDAYHAGRVTADARRDAKLCKAGYRVLHLPASLLARDLPRALALIKQALG